MVDASHEKEARAKETIAQLKSEITNLSRLVEQGAGLSMGQESQVNGCSRATRTRARARTRSPTLTNPHPHPSPSPSPSPDRSPSPKL